MKSLREQNGSASIEATISLVAFIFVIMAIYALGNFCIVQAKVSYAINTTAKEMSQYAYFYHIAGLDDIENSTDETAETAASAFEAFSTAINTGASEVSELTSDTDGYLTSLISGGQTDDLTELYSQIKAASSSLSGAISNPLDFVKSMAALGGSELADSVKQVLAATIARGLTERHFETDSLTADEYLESMGVVDGYDGMNFSLSTMLTGDGNDEIEVTVVYCLSLENIIPQLDQEVVICQTAVTTAWLGGDAS